VLPLPLRERVGERGKLYPWPQLCCVPLIRRFAPPSPARGEGNASFGLDSPQAPFLRATTNGRQAPYLTSPSAAQEFRRENPSCARRFRHGGPSEIRRFRSWRVRRAIKDSVRGEPVEP